MVNTIGILQATVTAVGDDPFYHGKSATPAWDEFVSDTIGLALIPLNMSEPVLVVKSKDAEHGLGFNPHGAGRNYSRTEHKRRNSLLPPEETLKVETDGLDIRLFENKIDKFGLAEIEDYIDPYGCIMDGDIEPFRKTRKEKRKSERR